MKRPIVRSLFGTALFVLVAAAAGAEELTVKSILTAHKAGTAADGIIAMVNDPANTIALTTGDVVTLRGAGVPESVMTAIEARLATQIPPATSIQPDDPRLVDLVRLIKSGISESLIAQQVRQSGRAFNLSVNDLLYLKQNGVLETSIGALMATRGPTTHAVPGAAAPAPSELAFDGLVEVRSTFFKKDRPGRLIMHGDSLAWMDGNDPKNNFEFQITGLEKVWFTCQARTPENFCYQINLQIVKGALYRFRDINQESGSNGAVLKVMEALRSYFPQVAFGSPDA